MPCSGVVATGHCCSIFLCATPAFLTHLNSVPVAQGVWPNSHSALAITRHSPKGHIPGQRAAPHSRAAWLEPRAGVLCSAHTVRDTLAARAWIFHRVCSATFPRKAGTAAARPGWQLECNWVSLCSSEASSDPSSGEPWNSQPVLCRFYFTLWQNLESEAGGYRQNNIYNFTWLKCFSPLSKCSPWALSPLQTEHRALPQPCWPWPWQPPRSSPGSLACPSSLQSGKPCSPSRRLSQPSDKTSPARQQCE